MSAFWIIKKTPIFIASCALFIVSLFVFTNSVFAVIYTPPSPGSGGSGTCASGGDDQIEPLSVCEAAGIVKSEQQCFQTPWTFKYASQCLVYYDSGKPGNCGYSYTYLYDTCNTGDRCLGGATAGSGGPINPGYVAPGICDASRYVAGNPDSACVSSPTAYKVCCTNGGSGSPVAPATTCLGSGPNVDLCPYGLITSAIVNGGTGTTCPPAPTPTPTPPPTPAPSPIAVDLKVDGSDGPLPLGAPSQQINLTWTSTNLDATGGCSASSSAGDWNGSYGGTNGGSPVQLTLNSAGTFTYTLTCSNSGGTPASDFVTVTVSSVDGGGHPPPSGGTKICGDSIVQSPNSAGVYEACDPPSARCSEDCLTYDSSGCIYFYGCTNDGYGDEGVIFSGDGVIPSTTWCGLGQKCVRHPEGENGNICVFSQCNTVGPLSISGRVYSDANSDGYSAGDPDYSGDYKITATWALGPSQSSQLCASNRWMFDFGSCMTRIQAGGLSYSEAYAFCIQCQYPSGPPDFPAPPTPTLTVDHPSGAASWRITNNGASIPWGIYNVSITKSDGSALPVTERSAFSIRGGYKCTAGDWSQSKNATCGSTGIIANVDFGVVQPPDVAVTFKSANKNNFDPGEQASFTYTVTNTSSKSATTAVGFWPVGGTGPNPMPNCPTAGGTPVSSPAPQTVTLAPLSSQDVTFNFNVGAIGATAYAYASYSCSPDDPNWANNLSGGKSYTVNVLAWFEGIGGDTGSQGTVSVTQTPPAGRYQSSFLVAGSSVDSRVQTQKWKINNYTSALVSSGGVYNNLAERFLQSAKKNADCSFGAASLLKYCDSGSDNGTVTLPASAPSGDGVWFIRGNLVIPNNFTLSGAVTFIVSGNITVGTNVTAINGIYVAGRVFNDFDASGNYGAQLVVNGGVYAQNVNLSRKLGGSACPSGDACNNTKTPADQFVFDPKYLVSLNNILGTPNISWSEVAP